MSADPIPRQTRWQTRRAAGKNTYRRVVAAFFVLLLLAFAIYVVALSRWVAPAFGA